VSRTDSLRQRVKLPPQSDVERHLLHFLYLCRRPIEPKDVYGPLADEFGLSQEQRIARRRDKDEPAWNNLVQLARWALVTLGWLENSRRGFWKLTGKGREEAEMRERFRDTANL
jgi:Mrr restriction endonuclease-like protein